MTRMTMEAKFWPKVDKNGPQPGPETLAAGLGPCWVWIAPIHRSGYAYIQSADGRRANLRAHRVSYEMANGPIPTGLDIDHLCRVRHCVNPAHLEPVTHRENQRRSPLIRDALWHGARTHCVNGHLYDEENTAYTNGYRRCRACSRESNRRQHGSKPRYEDGLGHRDRK